MNNLYGPYEGYIRGNLFRNLYNQYKNYEPVKLVPLNEYEEAWLNLSQLEFALEEINLYLDVFPDDVNAIREFEQVRIEYDKQLKAFTVYYGPLTMETAASAKAPWIWVNQNWPWEGGSL